MHPSRVALLSSIFTVLTAAQRTNIVPTTASATFPACALSCPSLLTAQSQCATQTEAGSIAQGLCFCTFQEGVAGSVTGLYYDPAGACGDLCITQTDRVTLQNWFQGYCRDVGQNINPLTATTTAGGTQTATGVTPSSTSTATSNPTAVIDSTDTTGLGTGQRQLMGSEWLAEKWPYVVMIIVILVGFLLIGIGAVCYRRRLRRKRASKFVATTAFANPSGMSQATDAEKGSPMVGGSIRDSGNVAGAGTTRQSKRYSSQSIISNTNRFSGLGRKKAAGAVSTDASNPEVDAISTRHDEDRDPHHDINPPRPASTRPRPSELDQDLRAASTRRARGRTSVDKAN